MDTKKLLSSMLFAAALMVIFFYFTRGSTSTPPAPYAIFGPVTRYFQPLEPGATPDVITLGDPTKESKDKVSIKINPATAGIDLVQLNVNNYAATYKHIDPLTLTLLGPLPGQAKPFSTMGIHVSIDNKELQFPFIGYPANPNKDQIYSTNATAIFDSQFLWKADKKVETATEATVDLSMTINDPAGKPIVKIVKRFHLDKTSYELTVTHFVHNLIALHTLQKPAADKVIDLAAKDVSAVAVRVGNAAKTVGKDYTVDAATGKISIANDGTIQATDTVDVDFRLPADTISVRIDQFGPTEMNRDDPQTDDRFFHSIHFNFGKKTVDDKNGFNLTHAELRKSTATGGTALVGGPTGQFADFTKDTQLWVASANRFFAIVVRPLPENVAPAGAPKVEQPVAAPVPASAPATAAARDAVAASGPASVRPVGAPTTWTDGGHNIDKPSHIAFANVDMMTVATKPEDDAAIIRFTGNPVVIPAGHIAEEPLSVYLGPKDRRTFEGDLAAPEGSPKYNFAVYHYITLIQFQQGCYSLCIRNSVIMPILKTLDFLKDHIAFGNYGIAIMILVVLVRACLHPLTRASQVNMAKMAKKMRDVAPKLEASKKRYADDKKRQNEEMMRIYKENNVNPAGGIMGCLPMFIQMPIWAALYSGLRNDIDLRHASFIPGWINDLASPDYVLPHGIPTIGHPLFHLPMLGDIYALNLLPILLAGVFFIQMKVSTASQPKPADEQQAQMQKMSQYMIFIFPLFLYNAPSGLNLYIFASTMAGLLDTWLVRKSLKKQGILPASAPALPTHEQK